jgi:hypothetical protein
VFQQHKPPSPGTVLKTLSIGRGPPALKSNRNSAAIQSFKSDCQPPQLVAFASPQPSGCVRTVRCRSRHRLGGAERRPWCFWLRAYDLLRAYGGASLPLKREPPTQNVLNIRTVAPSILQQDKVRQRSVDSSAVPGWSSPSKTRASRELCESAELNKWTIWCHSGNERLSRETSHPHETPTERSGSGPVAAQERRLNTCLVGTIQRDTGCTITSPKRTRFAGLSLRSRSAGEVEC